MSYEAKLAIFNKIKEYNRIFIFRHIRMDGDCTGATKGLKEILKIAEEQKVAIGAFNATSLTNIKAVMNAAEELPIRNMVMADLGMTRYFLLRNTKEPWANLNLI